MMSVTLSLGEIEALCLRAARGAGLDWGLAEEAGQAARWLCAAGLDGLTAVHATLTTPVATTLCVDTRTGAVTAPDDETPLCPLRTGAALSDHAALLPDTVRIARVVWPVLLIPFVARSARRSKRAVTFTADGAQVTVASDQSLSGAVATFAALRAARVTLTPAPDLPAPTTPPVRAASPLPKVLTGLDALALRTTVPATAASRADAGSALDDND